MAATAAVASTPRRLRATRANVLAAAAFLPLWRLTYVPFEYTICLVQHFKQCSRPLVGTLLCSPLSLSKRSSSDDKYYEPNLWRWVQPCQSLSHYRGPEIHYYIYIVIKGDFWPPLPMHCTIQSHLLNLLDYWFSLKKLAISKFIKSQVECYNVK
jgi:hypothetical protein